MKADGLAAAPAVDGEASRPAPDEHERESDEEHSDTEPLSASQAQGLESKMSVRHTELLARDSH